jgi:type 1 glutamine amidotransferase
MKPLKIAVITGGHPFDVQEFQQLFRSLPGIDAYVQHTDEFASEAQEVRDGYDVILIYSMYRDTPIDKVAWYSGTPKTAFERLGQTRQGIVLLHHAILAYRDWPLWDEIVGMKERVLRSYHPLESLRINIADLNHPVAAGLNAWEMVDETYVLEQAVMPDDVEGNRVFLKTVHPKSMPAIGWTRQYQHARVFCFASGHGKETYINPGFRQALAAGIHWTAQGG